MPILNDIIDVIHITVIILTELISLSKSSNLALRRKLDFGSRLSSISLLL